MIQQAIDTVVGGRSLSMDHAAEVMGEIMGGKATPAQFAAFVTGLRMKGETANEVAGMARIMREKSLRVSVPGPLIDTCGTGGDASGTFNISTAAGFVASGAGVVVAKHGNVRARRRIQPPLDVDVRVQAARDGTVVAKAIVHAAWQLPGGQRKRKREN